MLWKDGIDVSSQSQSKNHVDALIKVVGMVRFRFTGFYGFSELNLRYKSWDILCNIGKEVREEWIISDFKEIIEDAKKCGGWRKSKVAMEKFRKVADELTMVDIKQDKGWFMLTNNRRDGNLVKENIDRFLVSASWLRDLSFLTTEVRRQTCSYHDAILLDTEGRMPKEVTRDPRLLFRYEACCVKEVEAKGLIERAWSNGNSDFLSGIERTRTQLKDWQHRRYRDRKN